MTGARPRMPSVVRLLAAQIGYQARLLSSGRAVVIGVGLPVILLIASHAQRSNTTSAAGIAGYAAFGLTLTAWNTYGVRLVAAREAGVLKRWRATPLPRWCYFLSRILATVVVSVLAGAATVAVGVLLYGMHLTVSGGLAALVAFTIGAFAWAATATALTSAIPTVEAAAPTMMLTYFPVIIISGIFGSLSEPHWLSTIASYLPGQPLVDAIGIALAHTAGQPLLSVRDLLVLAAWAVAGLIAAVITFRWEPHRPAQRRPARAQQHHVADGAGSLRMTAK
jgi:ABC-2 type transport system permease protein